MQSPPRSRSRRALFAPLAGVLLLAGCGPKSPGVPKTAVGPGGRIGTAVVAGRVTLSGVPPANEKVTMTTDPFCSDHNPGETDLPVYAVGGDGALANVVLRVTEGIAGAYTAPTAAKQLDQKGCAFSPRVLALMTGQPLDIVSSDATLHNVHAAAKENEAFNLGMPAPGTRYTRIFERPEIVPFKCDVHPWMRAWVAVVAHPFFSVTGPDGRYEIKGLPAGTYTIEAWHEKLPSQTFTLSVGEGEVTAHDVTFVVSSIPSAPSASTVSGSPTAPSTGAPRTSAQ